MSSDTVLPTTKIVICTPTLSKDYSLPNNIKIQDIIDCVKTSLSMQEDNLILSRIDGVSFDPDATLSTLNIRNGETLLLTPMTHTTPGRESVTENILSLIPLQSKQISQKQVFTTFTEIFCLTNLTILSILAFLIRRIHHIPVSEQVVLCIVNGSIGILSFVYAWWIRVYKSKVKLSEIFFCTAILNLFLTPIFSYDFHHINIYSLIISLTITNILLLIIFNKFSYLGCVASFFQTITIIGLLVSLTYSMFHPAHDTLGYIILLITLTSTLFSPYISLWLSKTSISPPPNINPFTITTFSHRQLEDLHRKSCLIKQSFTGIIYGINFIIPIGLILTLPTHTHLQSKNMLCLILILVSNLIISKSWYNMFNKLSATISVSFTSLLMIIQGIVNTNTFTLFSGVILLIIVTVVLSLLGFNPILLESRVYPIPVKALFTIFSYLIYVITIIYMIYLTGLFDHIIHVS